MDEMREMRMRARLTKVALIATALCLVAVS